MCLSELVGASSCVGRLRFNSPQCIYNYICIKHVYYIYIYIILLNKKDDNLSMFAKEAHHVPVWSAPSGDALPPLEITSNTILSGGTTAKSGNFCTVNVGKYTSTRLWIIWG